MIRRSGRYFDGASSRHRDVELALYADGSVQLRGEGIHADLHLSALRVSPRLGNTPRVLSFPDGARCELADDDELSRALQGATARGVRRWIDALERRAGAALLAVALTIAALAAAVQLAIPALARLAARSLPAAAEAQLGDGALEALDDRWLQASALTAERRSEIEARFAALAAGIEPTPQLVLRASPAIGANALALPGSVVVMTDELVALAEHDDEIAAVLAHELGHVVNRHSLRAVLQNVGVGVLVAAALGDVVSVSSFAATLPTLMVQLQYSRRFEREADAYAMAQLDRSGIPVEFLASMLERLEADHGAGGLPSYLSTHPDTGERVRAIRRGAGARPD